MHDRPGLFAGGLRVLQLLILTSFAGCSSARKPPTPLPPPTAVATVAHHFGAPLIAFPTTRPIDAATVARDALAVSVRWSALERMPAGLSPVTATARLIALPSTTQPIGSSRATIADARLVTTALLDPFLNDLDHGRAGRVAPIAERRGVLPPDVTAEFDLTSPDKLRRLGVAVHRASGPGRVLQFALLLNDPPDGQRLLLDPLDTSGVTRAALVVPASFSGTPARAILAMIEVGPGSGPEYDQAVARCANDLSGIGAAASAVAMRSAIPQAGDWPGLAAALQTVAGRPADARAALVFLAGRTNATLCGDVALVAEEPAVAAIAQRVTSKIGSPATQPIAAAPLGWALDSACFEELAALQSAEKMPPELDAVLTSYAGEPGRHVGALDEVAKQLTSREQLEARLLAENLVYLEDASPAARVRAYDWLAARNQAPAGYDPLGPNRERRDALEKAMTAAATTAPAPPVPPPAAPVPPRAAPAGGASAASASSSAATAAGGVK